MKIMFPINVYNHYRYLFIYILNGQSEIMCILPSILDKYISKTMNIVIPIDQYYIKDKNLNAYDTVWMIEMYDI